MTPEQNRELQRRYRARLRADPVRWAAWKAKQAAERGDRDVAYMTKLKTDPVRYAAFLAKKRAERAERMKDPEKRAAYNARVLEVNKASQKRTVRNPLTWPIRAVTRLRYIAKEKCLPFNIEPSDIPVPDVCPILGTAFVFGEGYRDEHGPSVDRIRPELGYTKGNVRVISLRANRLKHELTDAADLRKVVADLDKLRGDTQ